MSPTLRQSNHSRGHLLCHLAGDWMARASSWNLNLCPVLAASLGNYWPCVATKIKKDSQPVIKCLHDSVLLDAATKKFQGQFCTLYWNIPPGGIRLFGWHSFPIPPRVPICNWEDMLSFTILCEVAESELVKFPLTDPNSSSHNL